MDKIQELAGDHRVVFVHLLGASECEYPSGWIAPMLLDLFRNQIFVEVGEEYQSMSKYTRLAFLKKSSILEMTELRQ
jgi:hypothetical protein